MAVSVFSWSLAIAQKSASSSKVCYGALLYVTEFGWFARHSNFPLFPSCFLYETGLTQLIRVFYLMYYNFLASFFFLIIIFLPSRAANLGNPEALIKLGLAHLYNEGSKWLFVLALRVSVWTISLFWVKTAIKLTVV